MRTLCAILVFCISLTSWSQSVVISEVMSDNKETFTDFQGDSPDWIELHNASDIDVDITGWFISDNQDDPFKWELPQCVLAPNSRRVIFASGKDLPDLWHCNFKISASGEPILLSNDNGELIHLADAYCIPEDESIVWDKSTEAFYYSSFTTPNQPNPEEFDFPCEVELEVTEAGGFYANAIEVEVEGQQHYPVVYALDGTRPNEASPVLEGSLVLDRQELSEDDQSFVPTTHDWVEPQLPLPKATVFSAAAMYGVCRVKGSVQETYFIGADLQIPNGVMVFSVTTDPDGFFSDEEGIYVQGDQNNYLHSGDAWKRDCSLEVYSANGEKVINQECEVKNRGKSSRYKPQKSLRFTAKSKYGKSRFDYPLFADRDQQSYRSINLRTGQAGFTHSMFADVLSADLVDGLHVDYQESQLVLLYINGEYWGIHDARENLDEHYIEQYHAIDSDSVTILKNDAEVLEGDNIEYQELVGFLMNHDMSVASNYDRACAQMDMQSYIDYNIMHMYAGNWDWPHNNVEYWKPQREGGKWRWFFFDCDACFYKTGFDSMQFFDDPSETHWSKVMLSRLFMNDQFRSRFTLRLYQLLSTNFRPSYVLDKIDSLQSLYSPLMRMHMQRWSTPPSHSTWLNSVEEMRRFALGRPQLLIDQIQEEFGNPLTFYPNPTSGQLYTNLPEDFDQVYITVFDNFGKQVLAGRYNGGDVLDFSGLEAGVYSLRVVVMDVVFVERVVKVG